MAVDAALRRPRLWLGVWVFGWLLCISLSLIQPPDLGAPQDSDKLGHFLAYGTLSAWAVALFATWSARLRAAVALVVLGIALEWAQGALTPYRMSDPMDALFNALGVGLGLLLGLTPLRKALVWLDRRLPAR